tara:strand:+ start:9240 stop:10766 length:1527 start_codon:yes stop_codon:yes gene_type:complete
MAQPLQNITISAPGFAGINTQDAPLMQNPSFAAIADNCIIDKEGRIASRKGYSMVSSNGATVLGSSAGIESVGEFVQTDGSKIVFSCGNNKIFNGTSTLVDKTGGATITANNWQMASLANKFYLFQRDHAPLVYDPSTTNLTTIAAHPAVAGTPIEGNICLAAFGRLWVADVTGNKQTIYWTDSLNGLIWTGGSSGSLDLTTVWPNGFDEITALAAHNNFLIVFGRRSIVVYGGASDPATMTLTDTILNIGCVGRDAIATTGKDLMFLDFSGVRSLSRTIQEKSAPIGDVSRNVNSEIKSRVQAETGDIKTVYDPNNAFLLVNFPTVGVVYCFDTRYPLENGSYRTTTWTGMQPLSFTITDADDLYIGVATGLAKYDSYTDDTGSYGLQYFSHPLSFGDSSRLKFLKKVNVTTFSGENSNVTLNWAYDYKGDYRVGVYALPNFVAAQYNISEFNTTAEYSSGASLINTQKVNTGGSGSVVQIGVTTTINGTEIAFQELNIQSTIGRIN